MAYLIFYANGVEADRRELPDHPTTALSLGRAPDCDIPVPDILLSRHHCQLELATDGRWVVLDLGSKNGTYLGNKQITRHTLNDGDDIRMGPRTRVRFRTGPFEPSTTEPGISRGMAARPVDPHEALAGTVSGFILVEPDAAELEGRMPSSPRPMPKPPEPAAYRTEDVYGMLSDMMSSSWDSIKEQASKPVVGERARPRATVCAQPMVKRKTKVAMSLQADAATPAAEAAADRENASERAESFSDSIAGMVVVPKAEPAPRAAIDFQAPPSTIRKPKQVKPGARASFNVKAFWRRPMKPGRRTLSPRGRRRMLVTVATILIVLGIAAAWSAAVYFGPHTVNASQIRDVLVIPQTRVPIVTLIRRPFPHLNPSIAVITMSEQRPDTAVAVAR